MINRLIVSRFVPVTMMVENLFWWSFAVQRSLHSACGTRSGVRLPILAVRICTSRGSKLVYALLDSGSEESLISKKLYNELNLNGVPLEVLLITANGSRNLVSTYDTNFKIGPSHSTI